MRPTLKLAQQMARGAQDMRELAEALLVARDAAYADARTLIRRRRSPAEAGVLRGDVQAWDGEVLSTDVDSGIFGGDSDDEPEGYADRDFYSWDRDEDAEKAWKDRP